LNPPTSLDGFHYTKILVNASYLLLMYLLRLPWEWRQYLPAKRWFLSTKPQVGRFLL